MEIKKSQVGLKELIATLVVSGILLIIGVIVFAKVYSTSDTMLSDGSDYGEATATISNVEGTTYDSFELGTIALVVLAAAVIIGILIRAFGA